MDGGGVLLVASDAQLVDQVLQLAGIVGINVLVTADGPAARTQWREPELILVASGLLAQVQGAVRRRNVLVIDDPSTPMDAGDKAELWTRALAVGAELLIALPGDEPELVRRLRDVADGPSRQGLVVGVIGACGGAGASTLAIGLALAASAQGDRVLALDADPMGGGLDLHLGAEDLPGVRWPDLLRTSGRLSAATLDYAMPHMNGVAVLAHARTSAAEPIPPEAMVALLDTAVRGYDLVVADIGRVMLADRPASVPLSHADDPGPRQVESGDCTELVLERSQALILLLPNRIAAVAAGMNLLQRIGSARSSIHLVIRQRSRGLSAADIGDALGVQPTAVLSDQSAVASAGEQGEFTSAYLRTCRALHRQLLQRYPKSGHQ